MKYFYDTEFLDDGATINLISIGIVCEDGREYYAVNSEMDEKRIQNSPWLCENVIPHLPLTGSEKKVHRHATGAQGYYWFLDTKSTLVKPKWVIANEVREFLLHGVTDTGGGVYLDGPELWAYYGAYDHVVLAQLWGPMINLPKGIPMWTHDLMQLRELNLNMAPPEVGVQHDALHDARWNRDFYNLIAKEQP